MVDTPVICPCCGANISGADLTRVVRGRFSYAPDDGFCIDGVRLGCSWRVHEVIGFLLLAAPQIVQKKTIASRFPYGGATPIRLIDVYLSQARQAARKLDEELPIKTVLGRGVSWVDHEVVS